MPIIHLEDGIPPSKSRLVDVSSSLGTVAAYGSINFPITPPKGVLWRIVNMRLYAGAPSGAASGTHEFRIYDASNYKILNAESIFSSKLEFSSFTWITADSFKYPVDEMAFLYALTTFKFDSESPINLRYVNGTDVTSASVGVHFIVEETPII